ncbi:MAG: hypothetical protein LC808_28320 [Actinobacteria bacterium]|nr:hypothetical protein [Actinomycetota bacterium]
MEAIGETPVIDRSSCLGLHMLYAFGELHEWLGGGTRWLVFFSLSVLAI